MLAEMEAAVRARIDQAAIFGIGTVKLEEVTARALAQVGVALALVDSATGGEVARLLRSSPEGDAALSVAHQVEGPEGLTSLLGVSAAQLEAFGWVSPMAAAAAAASLVDTYEGGWGLAALGAGTAADVYSDESGETYVALATPTVTEVVRYPFGGSGTVARRWVTLRVLDLLRRRALAQLSEERETKGDQA
jgi:nicotinamide mononucleotide (NMN) deamidase PncC